ncbi:MAG: polyprenyl synthetase family protein [Caulobacterales bacterium]|nr:polyprenyl synthetase family protein [Caulobacterales bacterium]
MARTEALIDARMQSPVGRIPMVAGHLIDAGGKRLRPILTIAAAKLFGYSGEDHIKLAATVEFIHTATLLHDDVVDGSALRRGRSAANVTFGNASSVLVGDFLFARAFNLMVETGSLRVLDILSTAARVIAEGEVRQLAAANDVDTDVDTYLEIIEAKTAVLFAAAAEVGPVLAGVSPAEERAMAVYGRELGLAFQLVDDALDYGGATARLGKNVGDDFREGKVTMPIVVALQDADPDERKFWARVVGGDQEPGDFGAALDLLRRRDAIAKTIDAARRHAAAARDALAVAPHGAIRSALEDLTDFVVERAY